MERSYGIIPLRRAGNQWETLLVKHGKGHWAFPKGHPESNEAPQETASRELKEETSLIVKQFIPVEPFEEFYTFMQKGALIEKIVSYYLAEVEGEVEIQEQEIDDFQWVTLKDAAKLATFPESKAFPEKVANILREQSIQ